MIEGIGIDIISVSRFSQDSLRPGDPFVKRSFTDGERAAAFSRSSAERYLIGRFAAKEAVYKAISSSVIDFRPGEIEVLDDDKGRPDVKLSGQTAAEIRSHMLSGFRILISISHETDYTVACAVMERKE